MILITCSERLLDWKQQEKNVLHSRLDAANKSVKVKNTKVSIACLGTRMHSVSASEVISECAQRVALGCIGHFEVIGATILSWSFADFIRKGGGGTPQIHNPISLKI